MKRNIALLAACVMASCGSSSSACCLFPFFPTYSAGYPMYGYAPAAYPMGGYYSASYAPSYGYNAGCCNTGYAVSYAGYSDGCCGTCTTGCGTCGSGCVGAGCIGTETRSVPKPDEGFPERDRKTFGSEDRLDYDEPGRRDRVRDPLDPLDNDGWNPGDRGRMNEPNDDFEGGDFNSPTRDFSRKPPVDSDMGDPMNEPLDRSSLKPPITAPVEEDTSNSEDEETPRDPSDVVPASEEDTSTTSLYEVRSFVRLAGDRSTKRTDGTRVSTSQKKQRAPRWIGAPAPTGRVRL